MPDGAEIGKNAMGAVHVAGSLVLGAFGMGGIAQQLGKVENDAGILPEWAGGSSEAAAAGVGGVIGTAAGSTSLGKGAANSGAVAPAGGGAAAPAGGGASDEAARLRAELEAQKRRVAELETQKQQGELDRLRAENEALKKQQEQREPDVSNVNWTPRARQTMGSSRSDFKSSRRPKVTIPRAEDFVIRKAPEEPKAQEPEPETIDGGQWGWDKAADEAEEYRRSRQPQVARQEEGLSCYWYRVREKDTLSKLAMRFYGDGRKWYQIYHANKDKIRDPDRLRPDALICIPQGKDRWVEESRPLRPSEEMGLPQPPMTPGGDSLGDAQIANAFLRSLGWDDAEISRILAGPT